MRGHCRGLRDLGAIRDTLARPSGHLQRLPTGRENGQRTGVHKPGLRGIGQRTRRETHLDAARQAHAKRLHREFQRQVPGRVLERAVVLEFAQARQCIAEWRQDYNEVRLHSSLGRIPPAQFAQQKRIQIFATDFNNNQFLD